MFYITEENREEWTRKFESMNFPELAAEFRRLKSELDEAKKRETKIRSIFDLLTIEIIPDKMAENGFRTLNLADGGGRIELRADARCNTAAGQGERLREWLKEHGYEAIVSESVHPGTLKAFIKEQKAAGEEVPPEDIVSYNPFTRATVVRAK